MAFHRGERTVSCFSFIWPVTFSLCWLLSAVHSCGSQAKWNVKVFLKCMHLFFCRRLLAEIEKTCRQQDTPDTCQILVTKHVEQWFLPYSSGEKTWPQFNLQFSPQCQLKPWMANEDTEFNSRIHQVEVISPESCDVAESASRLCSSTVSWTASLRKKK